MFSLRSWWWRTPLYCEMPISPDIIKVLVAGFVNYCSEIDVKIHVFRPTWSCLIVQILAIRTKFLELSGYCTVINSLFTFLLTNPLCCFHSVTALYEAVKYVPELVYDARSFARLSYPTRSKATHNMLGHQLLLCYQPQQIPTITWAASATWYTRRKQTRIKILQNIATQRERTWREKVWFSTLKHK